MNLLLAVCVTVATVGFVVWNLRTGPRPATSAGLVPYLRWRLPAIGLALTVAAGVAVAGPLDVAEPATFIAVVPIAGIVVVLVAEMRRLLAGLRQDRR